MSVFHRAACGRALFRAEDVLREAAWWEHEGSRAECVRVERLVGPDDLRRLSVWNRDGWYCCRLAAMRFKTDAFGVGTDFLVYKDTVVKFGRIWCPPCRFMDDVLAKPHARRPAGHGVLRGGRERVAGTLGALMAA